MRLLTFSILFVVICFSLNTDSYNKTDIVGLYSSIKPDFKEKVSIMYSKGHFNFLYTAPGETTLKIKENNTFIRRDTYCKVGVVEKEGNWSTDGNKLTLHYSDTTYKDNVYKILKNKIYTIRDFTLNENGKTMKSLNLLEKQ